MTGSAVESPTSAAMTAKRKNWIPAFAGVTARARSWMTSSAV